MENPLTRTFLCFVLCLVISEDGSITADECVQVNSCSCQFSDGRKIDLSPLSSNDVNSPRFYDVPVSPGSDDMFSWNPCMDFLQPSGSSCQGVAVCHIHLAPPIAVYFNLGTTETAVFSTNDAGQVSLSYQHIETGTPTIQRSSHIALICDQSQEGGFVPLFESDPGSGRFQFELHSKYTCYGDSTDDDNNVFSVGTIICVAALAIVLLYLVGGVSYNVIYKKSIGVERIPNVSVWRMLPGLIKDGFLFVFTRGRTSSTYRNI
ncbi:uncharacterized protein LOC110466575 [Mizuhopecten yessoensis]|uniref:Autophagy-related protein 27 n=1 Tax=Mizuhopecten yessoensis TaxID=6573 RepID=A0A210PP02_MIZYE|nr:uncharacterized protein LOC110466575 [Mizuhopecten yessoensis]OWF38198.1 Cation-dependent mannose-6-phosphate receptor [Mizuhopecten yessoensis]